jgi:hypothetical protein
MLAVHIDQVEPIAFDGELRKHFRRETLLREASGARF